MSPLILLLLLVSACAHASWNLIAKRAGGGLPFQALFTVLSVLFYAPVALALLLTGAVAWSSIFPLFMVGTALLHLAYFALLGRGYAAGDLSLVYPLARGSGPLLATALAVLLLGERPSAPAVAGALLIAAGIFFLTGRPAALRRAGSGRAVVFALLTGLAIASYTLWDKVAVTTIGASPVLYYWGATAIEGALLAPIVFRDPARRKVARVVWRSSWRAALAVGFLSPLAYFLVLFALTTTPVYAVAPVREIGILIGTVMGARLLAEGQARRRLVAAAMMLGGVVLLALG